MIAQIIPIKRLPRRFTHFDYTVPPELQEVIAIGQLVRIPLKSSEIFGLVLSLRETRESDTSALKAVIDLVHETPILFDAHLRQLTTLSSWYGVATGTLAKMMLLPLQKRKLKSVDFVPIDSKSPLLTKEGIKGRFSETAKASIHRQPHLTSPYQGEEPTKVSFAQYTNEQEHKDLLRCKLVNLQTYQTLILVPEITHITEITHLLSEHADDIITWHSGLSTKEQFERWLQIRNGEKRIIIGTRGAILLPFFNLKSIIIDYEHKNNHKHWDQAPRFHVKDIAELLRTSQGVDITLLSNSPSVETYFHVHKKNYSTRHLDRSPDEVQDEVERSPGNDEIPPLALGLGRDDVPIVNLSNERRGGNYSPISTTLEEALLNLKESAFLHINRLGLATYIGCNDCGWRAICQSCKLPQILHGKNQQLSCHYCKTTDKLPITCPKCKAAVVTLGGIGTETVEKFIKDFAKKHTLPHTIIRIDSQTSQPINSSTHKLILIGTDAAFPHIQWETTDLIALLDVDKALAIPEFRAGENLWHKMREINFNKHDDAELIIQTRDPDHLVLRSLTEPDRFYRTDLNHRMGLAYPPYTYLVRYFYGHADYREAKTVMETSVDVLNKRLAETQKNIQLSPAFDMHPRYYRGRHWFAVLARLDASSWQEDLIWLNSHIPATWKIDPNPNSVLSQ